MRNFYVAAVFVLLILGGVSCNRTPTEKSFHPLRTADFDEVAFTFQGKPIHPGCLWEFEVWLSDGGPPRVVAVDVESCTTSNANREPVENTSTGYLKARRTEREVVEYFGYKPVGMTSTGTHVLETFRAGGGGTLVEVSIYLLRFEVAGYLDLVPQQTAGKIANRVVMRCVGQIALGDRDDGRVELRGNTLVLGKLRYRAAEEQVQLQ